MSLFERFVPRSRLVTRLLPDHAPWTTVGRQIAPGLRQGLFTFAGGTASEAQDGASIATPVNPAEYGGWDSAHRLAAEHLWSLPAPQHRRLTTPTGATVDTFISDDVYGGTRLLVLDTLLAEHLRVERPRNGTLVIAPNRHMLAVHLIRDLTDLPSVIELLAELALVQHRIAEPISPWVYYRTAAGQLSVLSDGKNLTDSFRTVLGNLAAAASESVADGTRQELD